MMAMEPMGGSSALTQTSKRRCVMGAAVQCGVGEEKVQTTTTTQKKNTNI